MKSRYKKGQRVVYVMSGAKHGELATVEHVRPDGLLIVHFDADPAGSIAVVEPLKVRPIP